MIQDLGLVKPHMMIPEVTQLLLSVQVRSFTRCIDLFDLLILEELWTLYIWSFSIITCNITSIARNQTIYNIQYTDIYFFLNI